MCDELWGYVAKKQRNVRETDDETTAGDHWTWVALLLGAAGHVSE
jgi:hypothetical protein